MVFNITARQSDVSVAIYITFKCKVMIKVNMTIKCYFEWYFYQFMHYNLFIWNFCDNNFSGLYWNHTNIQYRYIYWLWNDKPLTNCIKYTDRAIVWIDIIIFTFVICSHVTNRWPWWGSCRWPCRRSCWRPCRRPCRWSSGRSHR